MDEYAYPSLSALRRTGLTTLKVASAPPPEALERQDGNVLSTDQVYKESEESDQDDSDYNDLDDELVEVKDRKQDAVEMTDYDRRRRENVLRNLSFMKQVGVSTAKLAARTSIGNEAEKAKRKLLAMKRAMRAAQQAERLRRPPRKSRRLEGRGAEMGPAGSDYIWTEIQAESGEVTRVLSKREKLPPKKMLPKKSNLNYHNVHKMSEENREFLSEIAQEFRCEEDTIVDEDDDVEYSLVDDDVVNVSEKGIHSVVFYPRADRIVVACGDKKGNVALWSPSASSPSRLATYRPHHNAAVTELLFCSASKLLSSSYDGTVREFDLHTLQSSLVYKRQNY